MNEMYEFCANQYRRNGKTKREKPAHNKLTISMQKRKPRPGKWQRCSMDRIAATTTSTAAKIKKINKSPRREKTRKKTINKNPIVNGYQKFFFGAFSNKINTSSTRIYTLKNT